MAWAVTAWIPLAFATGFVLGVEKVHKAAIGDTPNDDKMTDILEQIL